MLFVDAYVYNYHLSWNLIIYPGQISRIVHYFNLIIMKFIFLFPTLLFPLLFSSLIFTIALTAFSFSAQAADALDKSRDTVAKTNKQLQQKQQKIDGLHEQTGHLVDQYRATLRESESYQIFNKQLKEIVRSQDDDLISLQTQIVEIEVTAQQVMPMMQRMIIALRQFIEQDVPFLPVEREERLVKLESLMKRADVTVAEKYRKILEAYQIEIEYGKTLEAYQAMLDDKKVHFLKVGRIAFFYQTLDGTDFGVWHPQQKKWLAVDNREVRKSITMGLKIARKQRSPDLMTIMASTVEVSP